jgi:hypothetical protein
MNLEIVRYRRPIAIGLVTQRLIARLEQKEREIEQASNRAADAGPSENCDKGHHASVPPAQKWAVTECVT